MSIFPAQLLADNIDTVVILYPAAIHRDLIVAVMTFQIAIGFLSIACRLIEHVQTDQSFIVAVHFTEYLSLLTIHSNQEDQVKQNNYLQIFHFNNLFLVMILNILSFLNYNI